MGVFISDLCVRVYARMSAVILEKIGPVCEVVC